MLTGVRHGETLGSPIAIMIGNTEWPTWQPVMAPDQVAAAPLAAQARNAPLTRPRPGHADLAGMQKYDWNEARPILERASARETAARVALGEAGWGGCPCQCGPRAGAPGAGVKSAGRPRAPTADRDASGRFVRSEWHSSRLNLAYRDDKPRRYPARACGRSPEVTNGLKGAAPSHRESVPGTRQRPILPTIAGKGRHGHTCAKQVRLRSDPERFQPDCADERKSLPLRAVGHPYPGCLRRTRRHVKAHASDRLRADPQDDS